MAVKRSAPKPKPLIGDKKFREIAAYVEALQAKGKGPDEIVASLRRKFPEINSALVQQGWGSIIFPFLPSVPRK